MQSFDPSYGTVGTLGTVELNSNGTNMLELSRPNTQNGTVGTVENSSVPTVPTVPVGRDSSKPLQNKDLSSTVPSVPFLLSAEMVHEFLAYLRARGLMLRVDGERLLVAPRSALLPEDAELVRDNKAAILEALEWEANERVNDEIDAAVKIMEARI